MPTAAPIDLSAWQEQFDFLLPRKELLRADEIATALNCDLRTVLRLFEERKLAGHDINAGKDRRQQLRYRRDSVILWLASRANYAPTDLRERLCEILAKQPVSDLVLLHRALGELIRRKS
jgi:hypothetical protein